MIAFELWHPFGTGMERVRLMQRLQLESQLPTDFQALHPEVHHLLAPCLFQASYWPLQTLPLWIQVLADLARCKQFLQDST